MTGMPRVRPEHTYRDVVKFRKENLHRYWCNYSSHGVAGDDPGSARHRIALGDVVIVENQPRFKIQKGATIYTIGSCFARNVERSLKRQGFRRSEEHTSELQSLMRNSYAVFCLKKK